MFEQEKFSHVAFFSNYHTKFADENLHDIKDFQQLCKEICENISHVKYSDKSEMMQSFLREQIKKVTAAQVMESNMTFESKINAIQWFGLTRYYRPVIQQNNTTVEITSCNGMECIII